MDPGQLAKNSGISRAVHKDPALGLIYELPDLSYQCFPETLNASAIGVCTIVHGASTARLTLVIVVVTNAGAT
jgi:hypothetical protein